MSVKLYAVLQALKNVVIKQYCSTATKPYESMEQDRGPEIKPHTYSQLILQQKTEYTMGERQRILFISGVMKTETATCKIMKQLFSHPYKVKLR